MRYPMSILLSLSTLTLAVPPSQAGDSWPPRVEQSIGALERALRSHEYAAIEDLLAPGFSYAGHHVHALATRGGWTVSGEWIPVPYVDERAAEELFRHKVLALLRRRGLLSEDRIELLRSWRRSGFSVHNRVHAHPAQGREFEEVPQCEATLRRASGPTRYIPLA